MEKMEQIYVLSLDAGVWWDFCFVCVVLVRIGRVLRLCSAMHFMAHLNVYNINSFPIRRHKCQPIDTL